MADDHAEILALRTVTASRDIVLGGSTYLRRLFHIPLQFDGIKKQIEDHPLDSEVDTSSITSTVMAFLIEDPMGLVHGTKTRRMKAQWTIEYSIEYSNEEYFSLG